MSQRPNDFADLIRAWPSFDALASDIEVPRGTVSVWRYRNSIPAAHWARVVASAKRHSIPGVTYELLASFAARGRTA